MYGFNVVENGHVVTLIAPQTQTAALTSEIFSMENWAHATIIVQGGAGSASTVTVSECDDFSPSNAATKTFRYAQEATAAGDVVDAALASAATSGVAVGTATGIFLIIEIDKDELTDGYPCVQINVSASGSKLISALAILSGGRYQKDITATVIS